MKNRHNFYYKFIMILVVAVITCHSFTITAQITYEPLYNSTTFLNRAINTSFPVGSLQGSADVANGAASYIIPIEIPAGTNGKSPSISISYNSQANNTVLGLGWMINGLSSITRGLQSKYLDGQTGPIELNANDKFILDGQRLIETQGVYGQDGTHYSKELTDFSRTISHGLVGSGPAWFELQTKDGVILQYGNSTDSRFFNQNGTEVLSWALNKMIWPDGNYIEYVYITVDNEHRIKEINYTGNSTTGLQPYNKIAFEYYLSNFNRATYEAGRQIGHSHLIHEIEITAENNTPFKKYEFKYGHDDVNEFLVSVTEKGSDGSTLNPTIFLYGPAADTDFEPGVSGFSAPTSTRTFSGDYNGDGLTDIALMNIEINGDDYSMFRNFTVFKNNPATNSFQYKYNKILNKFGSVNTPSSQYNYFTGDFTGDGSDDIVYAFAVDADVYFSFDEVAIYSFTNDFATVTESTLQNPYQAYNRIDKGDKFFITGDYNGDGMSDFILILSTNLYDYKAFIYYGGTASIQELTLSGQALYHPITDWNAKNIHAIDFDGDGKSELMVTKGNYAEIFSFTGYTCKSIHGAGYPTEYHLIYTGDFNGDRKTDLMTRAGLNNTNAAWSITYSTGKDWYETPFSWQFGEPEIDENYMGTILHIADLNGDNRQDIFKGRTSTNASYQIHYSKGEGFHRVYDIWPYQEHAQIETAGDFNGDGRSDILYRNGTSSINVNSLYFNALGRELLLEKVKNGFNHITQWDYRLMTILSSTYTRTAPTQHPINTVIPAMYVAESLHQLDVLTTRYSYKNLKLHKEGRGLLGFEEIKKWCPQTDITASQEYEIMAPYYLLLPTYFYQKDENNTIMLWKHIAHNVQQLNTGNLHRILHHTIDNNLESHPINGKYVTYDYDYDTYGNVTHKTTNHSNKETTVEDMTYGTHGSFIPNRMLTHTVQKTRTGSPTHTSLTTFTYNTLGQTVTSKTYDGLPKSVLTEYFYNDLGNQDSTRISAAGLTTRTSGSTYDPKGRYVISSRNTLQQASYNSTYDVRWGKPTSSTGIDGLTTTYEYDAFGRLTTTHLPQGYDIQKNYTWHTTSPVYYAIECITPGAPTTKEYYDRLNRPSHKEVTGDNGSTITTGTSYTSKGTVYSKTAAYKAGETPLVTTYTYDYLDRVTSETNALGSTTYQHTTYQYPYVITATKVIPSGNQVSSTSYDPTDRIISSTDYGGTLTYTYTSLGQVSSVSQGGQVLVTSTYDDYGNRTSITDINTGTTTTDIDAYGQLVSETNALGHTTTMAYDDMGRIITRTGPEGTTTYEYYPTGSGASTNKLKKITSFEGDIEEYMYDALGRLITHTHEIDGVTHSETMTYDAYDRLETTTYSGGFGVRYIRDSYGYIQQVTNLPQSHTFFYNPVRNGYLQPTSYQISNFHNSIVTKGYHYGIPTSFHTSDYYEMDYTWDYASGNLMSRSLHAQGESFTYDHLNRLKTTSHVASAITVDYAANGNILSKTDAGTGYHYDTDRIHAMRGITTPNYPNNINLSAQNISYTTFLQPREISEGNLRLTYTYGSDHNRIKSVLKVDGVERERIYYMGSHERKIKNGTTYDIYYVSEGDDLIAIVVRTNNAATRYYYTYTDYLGSIQEIVSSYDPSSVTGAIQNYDAWGRRRNHNYEYTNLWTPPDWLIRGYTGHEMLWDFRLINMNGRIYDPVLGRVLSPDNEVGMPHHTQGYNRYTYAHNNPLSYTDPDGNFPILAGAAIGAAIGLLANGVGNAIHHRSFFDGAGKAIAFGAIGGIVSGGIGSLAQMAASPAEAMVAQAMLHGIYGGVVSFAQDGNPMSGFASGSVSSIVGSFTTQLGAGATATLMGGALSGGVGAAVAGGDFWQGVQQGLITTGLNHLAHPLMMGPGDPPNKRRFYFMGDKFENAQFQKDIQSGLLNPDVAYDSYMGFADIGLGFAGSFFPTSWIKSFLGTRGVMTELQLVTRATQKAETAIGGSGGVAGTLKHTYAKKLLSRYQSRFGGNLSLGSNYFNNGISNRGFLDVVNHSTKTIYDFKFGGAVMNNAQFLKYSRNFEGYSIHIIRP